MRPRTDVVVEESEGELIVLDKDAGKVHQLNESAALVWSSLADGLEAGEIANRLANAFEVDNDRAVSDVMIIITQFKELNLLED